MIDILVVDDHAVVREGLRYLLSDGIEFNVVGVAASGQEALACLRQQHIDVVLLDLFMPDSEGLKTLRLVKQQAPEVTVLLFSGAPATEHGLASLEAGAAGFVSKDCDPGELREAVRRVAAGEKYVDAALAVWLVRNQAVNGHKTPSGTARLSGREQDVMTRIARGEALSSIANNLVLSIKTVSTYRRQILDKLELDSNADLVRYALRHGLE
jgi:DNA-binding NarL/FixJ family response regulator